MTSSENNLERLCFNFRMSHFHTSFRYCFWCVRVVSLCMLITM